MKILRYIGMALAGAFILTGAASASGSSSYGGNGNGSGSHSSYYQNQNDYNYRYNNGHNQGKDKAYWYAYNVGRGNGSYNDDCGYSNYTSDAYYAGYVAGYREGYYAGYWAGVQNRGGNSWSSYNGNGQGHNCYYDNNSYSYNNDRRYSYR
jgi:hypothetical protein